jgi:hypothetical protein
MKNFGKYALIQPIEYHFKLEPDWTWTINPPTSGDEMEMSRFLNRGKFTLGLEGTTREAPPTWLEIAHRELAITFGGTTIPGDDKPLLDKDASIVVVEMVLQEMPHEMVMELWMALGEVVPLWGGRQASLPNPESRTSPAS